MKIKTTDMAAVVRREGLEGGMPKPSAHASIISPQKGATAVSGLI